MPNMQNHANLESSVRENELFMVIKLDAARSAEFHFSILFFHGWSQSVRLNVLLYEYKFLMTGTSGYI